MRRFNVLARSGVAMSVALLGWAQVATSSPLEAAAASAALPYCGPTLAAGEGHSLALRADGAVFAFGLAFSGQLGNNDSSHTNQDGPVQVKDALGTGFLAGVIGIAAGGNHSMALKGDGTVWTWGLNDNGELGNNDPTHTHSDRPLEVLAGGTSDQPLTNVVAIAAGRYHSLALKADGTLWSWGNNSNGQLGNEDAPNGKDAPVQVHQVGGGSGFLTGVIAIGAGNYYSMALLSDHTVVTFGQNDAGQLGNNDSTHTDSAFPVHVLALTGTGNLGSVAQIAPNRHQALALLADTSLVGWGSNQTGEIGNGQHVINHYDRPVVAAGAITGFRSVAVGGHHVLAIKSDGSAWSWGKDSNGQLGNNATTENDSPAIVLGRSSDPAGLKDVIEVAAGDNHSLALSTDGTISSFGYDGSGQLGDGDSTFTGTQKVPVKVSQTSGLSAVPGPCLLVSSVQGASASCNGGNQVTVNGSGFLGATSVKFGNTNAQSFSVSSDLSLTAVNPASSVGATDITVTTPRGTTAATSADSFSCVAAATAAVALPKAGLGQHSPTGLAAWLGLALAGVALLLVPLRRRLRT